MASSAKQERRLSTSSDETRNRRTTEGATGILHSSNGRAAGGHQSKSHVSFSSTPASVFNTYSAVEYERKDLEADPLTSSVVFQLEKMADTLDSFDVTLNKGSAGLGFSIIGMGFGDDLGPDDKLCICIKQILEKGTAQKDGRIQPGDQIIEVNGKSMVGVTYYEAVEILKGVTGKVSLRMGRGKPGGVTPEELVQMGASFKAPPSTVSQHNDEVSRKAALAALAAIPGPSTSMGHQSGHIHINADHRLTNEVAKPATLTKQSHIRRNSSSDEEKARKIAGHQGSSSTTIGHPSGKINDDHRLTNEVTKTTTLIKRRDSSSDEEKKRKGSSTSVGHLPSGRINDDHKLSNEVTSLTTRRNSSSDEEKKRKGSISTAGHQTGKINDDHRPSNDVTKTTTLTTHATFQGPSSAAVGHQSGQMNDDHRRLSDDVFKAAALAAKTRTRRGSSSDEEKTRKGSSTTTGHHGGKINDDHRLTNEVTKTTTLIKRRDSSSDEEKKRKGSSSTVGHLGKINDDHRHSNELTKTTTLTTHATFQAPSTTVGHLQSVRINDDHRLTNELTKTTTITAQTHTRRDSSSDEEKARKKTPSTSIVHQSSSKIDVDRRLSDDVFQTTALNTRSFSRRHSSSDEEEARRRLGSDFHDNDDQPNPRTLMLKLELASIKRQELERQLEVIRAEIDGVLIHRGSDGSNGVKNDRIKLIEVEAALAKAKRETDRMKGLRNDSEKQIGELDKRLRSEIRSMHETHSKSLQVIEQCRTKDRDHAKEKESIKKRLSDMDHQFERQIHTLTEKIRHLEVRFTGNFDEVDTLRVTPGGAAPAVNHANDRSHGKETMQHSLPDKKTGGHSSDSDSDGERRKLTTTLPVSSSGPAHAQSLKTASVSSVHSPAKKSTDTSSSMTTIVKTTRHFDSDSDLVFDDAPPNYAPPPVPDDDSSDSDKATPTVLQTNRSESVDDRHRLQIGVAMGAAIAGQRLQEKRLLKEGGTAWSSQRSNEGHGHLEGSNVHGNKLEHGSSSDEGERLKIGAHLKSDTNLRERGSSDEEGLRKNLKMIERAHSSDVKQIERVGSIDSLKTNNISEKVQKSAHDSHSSDDESSKRKSGFGVEKSEMAAVKGDGSGIVRASEAGVLIDEPRLSVERRHSVGSDRSSETGERPVIAGTLHRDNSLERGKMSDDDSDKELKSQKEAKKAGQEKTSTDKKFSLFGTRKKRTETNEERTDDESEDEQTKTKKSKTKWGRKQKDEDKHTGEHEYDSDENTRKKTSSKEDKKKAKEEAKQKKEEKKLAKADAKKKKKENDGITLPVMGVGVALQNPEDVSSEEEFNHSASKKNKKVSSKGNEGITYPVMGGAIALGKQENISSEDDTNHPASKKNKKGLSKDSGGITFPIIGAGVALETQGQVSSSASKKNTNVLPRDGDGIAYPVMGLKVSLENKGEVSSEDELSHSTAKKNQKVPSKETGGISYPAMGIGIALEGKGDISSEDELDHSGSKKGKKVLSKSNDGISYPVMAGAVVLENRGDISSSEKFNHSASAKKTVSSMSSDGITYPVMGTAVALEKRGDDSSGDEVIIAAPKRNKKSLSGDSDGIKYPVMGGAIAMKKQGELSSDEEDINKASKSKKGLPRDSEGISYPAMGVSVALEKQGDISSSEEFNHSASKKNKKVASKDGGGIALPIFGMSAALENRGENSSSEEMKNSASKKNQKSLSRDSGGIALPVMGLKVALENKDVSSSEEFSHSTLNKNQKVPSKETGGISYPAMGIGVALEGKGDISSEDEVDHSSSKKGKKVLSKGSDGISYPVMAGAVALENRGDISSSEKFNHSASAKKTVSSMNNDGITYPAMGMAVALGKSGESSTTQHASPGAGPDVQIASRVHKQRDSDGISLGSRGSSSFGDNGDESHRQSRLKSSHKEVHRTIEDSFRPWKSTPDVSGNRDMVLSVSSLPGSSGQAEYMRLAERWSKEDVTNWLISINLGELGQVFDRHDVDGLKLLALSNNSFKEMEISGKNKDTLKKRIKELQSAIAKDKKLREKEEKLREKEEKAQEKLRKKEASKTKTGKKHRGTDHGSVGSRASSGSKEEDEDRSHSRSTSSHVEMHTPMEATFRQWKSTSDVSASSGLMMSFSSYPSSVGHMESTVRMADQWSTEEVNAWLIAVNLGELSEVFERHDVDGQKLLALSNNSFKEMDISGKNKDLLKKKIKELQSAIAKEKKLREKDEKLREKEEKAQAKRQKKEASKNK